MRQAVSLSFFRFSGLSPRLWAFAMMGLSKRAFDQTPDIGFWKVCGTGAGHGFTPTAQIKVVTVLATWPDADVARERVAAAPIYARYRARSDEDWTVFLNPVSARGEWSGTTPFHAEQTAQTAGPLAALTRASLKPKVMRKFWGRVPRISDLIGSDPSVLFKIGFGEIPLLHQVTFSIWPDVPSMNAFARTGPHADAIRAVRDEGWFAEELYARFAIHSDLGTWGGVSPLNRLEAK